MSLTVLTAVRDSYTEASDQSKSAASRDETMDNGCLELLTYVEFVRYTNS